MNHVTRLLAVSLAPDIRVNAVAPGLVDTPLTVEWTQAQALWKPRSPMRRAANPEDIAQLVTRRSTGEYPGYVAYDPQRNIEAMQLRRRRSAKSSCSSEPDAAGLRHWVLECRLPSQEPQRFDFMAYSAPRFFSCGCRGGQCRRIEVAVSRGPSREVR